MSTISTTDVVNGTTTDASVINNNFTNVKDVVNGNIDNGNISTNAAIAVSKLAPGTNTHVLTTVAGVATWQAPASGGSSGAVPAGAVSMFAGSVAPSGWLLCDGSAVSRTTFADLFTAIGTAYGAGDGSTTFNVPDTRGRVMVGKGTNAAVDTLGENDGVAVANRRPQHRHTPHTHSYTSSTDTIVQTTGASASAANVGATTGASDGGSGNANDALDAPAYIVFNTIIKT